MNAIPQMSPLPSAWAWLYALLSLFISLALSGLVLILAALWEHEWAVNEIDSAVSAGRQEDIQRLLPVVEKGASRVDLAYDFIAFADSAPQRAKLRVFLYDVGFRRDLSNIRELQSSLNDWEALYAITFTPDHRALLKRIHQMLVELKELEASLKTDRKLAADLQLRRKKLVEQHRLVAEDFGLFFSLPTLYSAQENTPEIRAYKYGVLADLPSLKGLPDSLESPLALREALTQAGGRVLLESSDPAGEFKERLASFHETSKKIVSEHQSAQAAEEAARAQILELESSIPNLIKNIRSAVSHSISVTARSLE